MKRLLAGLLLIILLLTGCSSKVQPSAEFNGTGVATLSAVGDIYLTDSMLKDARTPEGSFDFSSQFEDVVVPLYQSDIAIGNFEGNFTGNSFGRENGSYPDALADALYNAGFDILQTANSYSIFNGISGLERTKAVIEGAQMKPLGTCINSDDREQNQVLLKEVQGIRIAFVAFTKGVGGLIIPEDTDCSVNLLYKDYTSGYSEIDRDGIEKVLNQARGLNPDIIVAALHWGSENIEEISPSQEEIAEFLMERGVDVILGSHSHLVAPIERPVVTTKYGEEKQCLVAYSLGDFCAVEADGCNTSLILTVEFTKDRKTGRTVISQADYIPVSAIDCGKAVSDRFRVVNSRDALERYEENYFDRITEEQYEKIKNDLEKLQEKVHLK